MYNIRRILLFVFGLFILSLGSVLSMRSGLGVSPTSSISYVLSTITGFSVGTVTFVFFSCFSASPKNYTRKDFPSKKLSSGLLFLYFWPIHGFKRMDN